MLDELEIGDKIAIRITDEKEWKDRITAIIEDSKK